MVDSRLLRCLGRLGGCKVSMLPCQLTIGLEIGSLAEEEPRSAAHLNEIATGARVDRNGKGVAWTDMADLIESDDSAVVEDLPLPLELSNDRALESKRAELVLVKA